MNLSPTFTCVIIVFLSLLCPNKEDPRGQKSAAVGYCCCHGERKIPHPHESAARIMHASGGTSCDAAYKSSPTSRERHIQSWHHYT